MDSFAINEIFGVALQAGGWIPHRFIPSFRICFMIEHKE